MKNTKTWVKVLLLAFCLVFVFSSLIACGTDEKLADLQNQLDDLKNKTDSTATDLDTDKAAKDAAIAELKTALAAVKTTADAAATAAALEAVAADLAADEAALAAAVTELKEALATKAATEAVEAKIAAVEALVKANDKADAEKAEELEAAIAALTKTVNDNKTAIDATIATEVAKLNEAIKGSTEAATKAVEKLTATVEENKKAADEAVKNLSSDMNKKVEKIEAAIAETNKALEGKADAKALEELKKTVEEGVAAEVKALTEAIATKADKTAVDAAVASATEAIEAMGTKVTALETKVDTMKAAIEAEIETLKGAVSALETKVEALANAEEINAAIEALADRVATLEDAFSAEDLADAYNYATKVLNGDDDIAEEDKGYSLADFDKMFYDINSNLYSEAEYASFKAAYENLKFFLNRALNVEDIKAYFTQMEDTVDALPTLVESLEAEIVAIETGKLVTLDAKCIEKLVAIYTQIGNVNAAEKDPSKLIVVGEDLETRYTKIVDAQANLVAADKAAANVEAAISAVVVDAKYGLMYQVSDESLNNANYIVRSYMNAYFSNETYNALYANAVEMGRAMVDNWATYHSYMFRFNQLSEAAKAKPVLPDYVTNYTENKPMWFDFNSENGLVALVEAISEWRIANNIDDVNYALIYPAYANIDAAYAYAKYMNETVYVGLKVEELIKNVNEFCTKCETQVLFADAKTVAAYREQINAIVKAIEDCTDFNALSDHNDDKMLPADMLKKFADVETVMNALQVAARAVAEYTKAMTEKLGKVTFADYEQINTWKGNIEAACKNAAITMDETDPNYNTIGAEAAMGLYEQLLAEYQVLTAKIAEVYLKIDALLQGGSWELADGKYVEEVSNYFAELVNKYNIDRVQIALTLTYEDGTVEGDLNEIYMTWNQVASDYYDFADAAVAAAVEVNKAIADLATLATTNLNNWQAYADAWTLFCNWCTEYLHVDATKTELAALIEKFEAIQNIKAAGGDNKGTIYAFVTTENAEAIYTDFAAIDAHKAAAADAWKVLGAELAAISGDKWNIHSDFKTPATNYATYLTTYYAGKIEANVEGGDGWNGENIAYKAYEEALVDYEDAYEYAEALATEIKNKINALAAINDYAVIEEKIAEINALIAEYNAKVKCTGEDETSVMDCRVETWAVTDADVIAFAKAGARATFLKACATFVSKNGDLVDTVVNVNEINIVRDNAEWTLADIQNMSIEEAEKALASLLAVVDGQLAIYQEKINTYNAKVEEAEAFKTLNGLDDTTAVTDEDVDNALAALKEGLKAPKKVDRDAAVKAFNDAIVAFQKTIDAATEGDAGELV